MLIKPEKKYIPELMRLWHEVFGDSSDYIELFFKEAYYNSECFCITENGEIVSAFYLLKCEIKSEGRIFNGRYLYAAATLPRWRGKGYMGELIREAIAYCKEKELDFIALVPADDGLYDYYGRFGFYEAMHKYCFNISNEAVTLKAYREIYEAQEFAARRSSADNMLIYDAIGLRYAFDCLSFTGSKILAFGEKSFYIDGEELFIGSSDDNADAFLSSLGGERAIYTNKPKHGCQRLRNGMIYSFCNGLKNKEIYMNIALD